MGLFDRLSGKKNSGKGKNEDQGALSAYSGMRVEVLDQKTGTALFSARVSVSWDGNVELQPISTPAPATSQLASIPVSLRGYEESTRKAVHMDCVIDRRGDGVWVARRLEVTGKDNDRAFYRQDTSIRGEVMKAGRTGIVSQSCELVNISAGGVCIRVEETYALGDKLLLNSQLLPGWDLAPLVCVVRRATRKRGAVYEYGCEFQNLSPATEDMIAKAIMEMQRKRMNR